MRREGRAGGSEAVEDVGLALLFIDNTSAIDVAKAPMYYDKSKHINRRDLFVRELVSNGAIKVEYIKTKDNPADALTKPLPKPAFMKHRATMLGA